MCHPSCMMGLFDSLNAPRRKEKTMARTAATFTKTGQTPSFRRRARWSSAATPQKQLIWNVIEAEFKAGVSSVSADDIVTRLDDNGTHVPRKNVVYYVNQFTKQGYLFSSAAASGASTTQSTKSVQSAGSAFEARQMALIGLKHALLASCREYGINTEVVEKEWAVILKIMSRIGNGATREEAATALTMATCRTNALITRVYNERK